ncbi:MAG: alpha/beta hydrolase [Novosphingobium sp.]|nr:alpha/beta hydrolase [Novosphingobium sp.]
MKPSEHHFVTRDGCSLRYWLRGQGRLITLTPGGREAGEAVAALADLLAEEACVLTWDRRNAGGSDVWFGGDVEAEVWADDLSDLIAHLGLGPAWIAGGSAGCRTSALSALRHPETARGLLLWSASGGPYSCQFLGFSYHVPYIMAAEAGGMEAVGQSPFFADRIAANPGNRERLLALDPTQFAEQMKRWNEAFYYSPEASLAGVPDADLSTISIPTLIVAGNDDVHPPSVSDAIARLVPGATHIPSPWSNEQWMDMFTGRKGGSVFDLYPLLAPALLEFVGRHS